jgi:hypothetical protein
MAYSPIAFIAPNYSDYGTYWLKAYLPGSTTPKLLAIELTAATTFAKLQLNVDGFFKSAGGALITPYVEGAYDAYLFQTEAEADANNTAGAIRLADNITPLADAQLRTDLAAGTASIFGITAERVGSYLKYDNVAEMKVSNPPIGSRIKLNRFRSGEDLLSGLEYVIQSAGGANEYIDHTLANGNIAKLMFLGSLNIKLAGAVGDAFGAGSFDETAIVTACLLQVSDITFPEGEFRIDGTISLGLRKTLRLLNGAVLRRTTDTSNTDPIVHFINQSSSVLGSGQNTSTISSLNDSPNGVVLLGASSMSTTLSNLVNYNTIKDLAISGSTNFGKTTGLPNAALLIQNPQLNSNTVYFNNISGLRVSAANYGIWLKGWANANTISNIQGYRLGDDTILGGALFYDNGSLDNAITNCFLHQSTNAAGIKLEQFDNTAVTGGHLHRTFATSYSNIVTEQGGAAATGITALDGTVASCYFEVRHNSAGGNSLDAAFLTRNYFFGLGASRATNTRELNTSISSLSEATNYKIVDITTLTNSTSAVVEIIASGRWGSGIGTEDVDTATFSVYRNAAGTVTVTCISNSAPNFYRNNGISIPVVTGNVVSFGYLTSTNGTTTTTQAASFNVKVVGYFSSIAQFSSATIATSSAKQIGQQSISLNTTLWTSGTGTPEGSIAAIVGSVYTRLDGSSGTTLYVKESGSGNTGWVAK